MSSVPLFASSLEPYLDRLTEALERVARDGRYILGPEVEAFEEEFARYLGVRHCVGVANGTDALTIALKAAGVGPGDDVVLPSFTFSASAHAVVWNGLRPALAECDPNSFQLDLADAEARLDEADAILATHMFGAPCQPSAVQKLAEARGVPAVFDAAHAFGASLSIHQLRVSGWPVASSLPNEVQ